MLKRIISEYIGKKLYKFQYTSESYISWMRERGAKIGENVTIFDPRNTLLDVTRPYMIEIGDNVQITRGVIILTHGYDWAVLKSVYGEILGSCGTIKIGNNVFIGMNTVILKGANIGNNVIIGAGSVVTHDLDNNAVYAGNPAKYIMSLEEYYEKRKAAQISEAKDQTLKYKERLMMRPDKKALREFFFLFEDATDESSLFGEYKRMLGFTGNYEESIDKFKKTRQLRPFSDIDAFIDFCDSDSFDKDKI